MKARIVAAVLAGCGLVLALPPGQGSHNLPGSGYGVCGTPHRYRCSGWHHASYTLSMPSITHLSGAPSSSVPTSRLPSSSIASTSIASKTSSAPPTVITCELGTAIGRQEGDSVTLDTQSGGGCNRWGWYETPTLAELQSGISGILYVGAGGNNIDNAIGVGDWTAIASPTGGVTVTYSLDPGYFIDEAHIDLDCLPIDSRAPSQYTFNSGALPNLPVYSNPTPLQYPTCFGGSQAYLIIHGSINYLTTTTTCSPPVAT
jgi:hypothetical protein